MTQYLPKPGLATPAGIDPWERLDAGAAPLPEKTGRRHKSAGKPRHPKQIKHIPSDETRKMIANMASYGLDVITISKLAGIAPNTLYRHYKHEMTTSAARKDLLVLQSAFLKAVGGPDQNWEKADAAMQKWWIGVRQGWRPPADRSINTNLNMDLSKLTDRQLDELERIMEAAALDDRGRSAREGGEEYIEDGSGEE